MCEWVGVRVCECVGMRVCECVSGWVCECVSVDEFHLIVCVCVCVYAVKLSHIQYTVGM